MNDKTLVLRYECESVFKKIKLTLERLQLESSLCNVGISFLIRTILTRRPLGILVVEAE